MEEVKPIVKDELNNSSPAERHEITTLKIPSLFETEKL
jgi:hypothetical protein